MARRMPALPPMDGKVYAMKNQEWVSIDPTVVELPQEVQELALFYGGYTPETVIKADLGDLSTLIYSVSYGGTIFAIAIDDTYIYIGGSTTNTVRKYLKSDLSYISESESYGGIINTIAIG